ncbi:MAG: mechanosensitive ion channel family protein [Alphaproteobacteria bacterium]
MFEDFFNNEYYQQIMVLLKDILPIIIEYGIALIRALLVLLIGYWIARSVSSYLSKILAKFGYIDQTIRNFIPLFVRYLVWVFTLVIVLAQIGVQTASIIALLGAAGLAIGLALQGTLQNIAAGLMLLLLRPFRVDDYIEAGGINGTVKQIGLFNTEMRSIQGQYMAVPNSNLWNVTIVNYSTHPIARIDIDVSIAYEDDIDTALGVLRALAAGDAEILKDPEPQYLVISLGASGIDVRLRCWVKSADQWKIGFRLNRDVKYAIEAAGLSIPFPQRVLHIVNEQSENDKI